jgi:hypothetical protein
MLIADGYRSPASAAPPPSFQHAAAFDAEPLAHASAAAATPSRCRRRGFSPRHAIDAAIVFFHFFHFHIDAFRYFDDRLLIFSLHFAFEFF